VHQLVINAVDQCCANLIASVGSKQVCHVVQAGIRLIEAVATVDAKNGLHAIHGDVYEHITHLTALGSLSRKATVYDNQHLGSHVNVVVHFTNDATEHSNGGVHSWFPLHPWLHRARYAA
jgi:hypothetical protein